MDPLARLQEFVYVRRIRMQDLWIDFDPLRRGVVPRAVFVRVVNLLGSGLTVPEVEKLADDFSSPDGIQWPAFWKAVDAVFEDGLGSALARAGPADADDETAAVLYKIALLCKTRGFVLKQCFEDFDRSDSASITVPRRGGKVTETVFLREFPFSNDLTAQQMQLLLTRYREPMTQFMNYRALHEDVTGVSGKVSMPQLPTSGYIPPKDHSLGWTAESASVIEKLRTIVVERRLRIREFFRDFDPLRKGYCTAAQLKTVLAILNVQLTEAEVQELLDQFSRPEDEQFGHELFCQRIEDGFQRTRLETDPMASLKSEMGISDLDATRRSRRRLSPEDEEACELVCDRIAARIKERRVLMYPQFVYFDKTRQGHITVSQFHRVLATMNFELSDSDIKLLSLRFCDKGNAKDINYVDFYRTVDAEHK